FVARTAFDPGTEVPDDQRTVEPLCSTRLPSVCIVRRQPLRGDRSCPPDGRVCPSSSWLYGPSSGAAVPVRCAFAPKVAQPISPAPPPVVTYEPTTAPEPL